MTQLEFIRQTLEKPYNQEIDYKAMASALLAMLDDVYSWPFPPTKGSPITGQIIAISSSDEALI